MKGRTIDAGGLFVYWSLCMAECEELPKPDFPSVWAFACVSCFNPLFGGFTEYVCISEAISEEQSFDVHGEASLEFGFLP